MSDEVLYIQKTEKDEHGFKNNDLNFKKEIIKMKQKKN